jgi:hypothetical protein
MLLRIILSLGFLCSIHTVSAQTVTPLDGVYERISLTNTYTGTQLDAGQIGLLIIAHGYYSMITMKPDRPLLAQGQRMDDLPDKDQIEFMKSWLEMNGHTGPCEVKSDTLIWHRNISENPREVGTTTRLPYLVKDGQLVLHFNLANDSRWEWAWRKIK